MRTLLTIVIAALSLNAFGQVPEYVPTDGLVAWWPFNGNAFDESDYQNDGTVNGASLTEDRFGNPNSAYSFDGVDDFIGVNSLNAFQYNPVSYSFWYVLETLCTNTAYNTFCAKLAIGRDVSGNTLQGSIGLINNTEPDYTFNKFAYYTGCCTGLTEFTPSLHEWHQMVMIYDVNETLKWYHDGELISSESFASGSDANIPFNIGSGGNRHFWDGILDDLGVWNRSLSDEEVQALYLANLYVTGCTDSTACNYNPDAIEDDGNCDYSCCPGPGCCLDGTVWSYELEGCVVEIPTDSNIDGCTDLNDLMDLLSSYGICLETE